MENIKKVLLHIGCGHRYHPGFINSDKEPNSPVNGKPYKLDEILDITKPWPYADESVDGIVSMVVFQHLDWVQLYFAFTEMYRVLKKGGVMRFGVVLEETNQPLKVFLFGRNKQIYNFELFRSVLTGRIGFRSIKLCNYQETAVPEFKEVDCRHGRGTSYIEVVK